MKNYIIKFGRDCDGYRSPSCRKFATEKQAENYCYKYAQYTDGDWFKTADKIEALNYCIDEEINFPNKF